MLVRTHQGDTLDLLAWRHLGTTAGVVEATLTASPALAEYGPTLPAGVAVELATPTATAPTVQLWD